MEMLNENLRIELIVHLNGKMLHESTLFKFFNLSFLSELTFLLKRESFSMNQTMLREDEYGDRLYYVTKGTVELIQKKTATFIAEVPVDSFIGEVAFFTGLPRSATAKSKTFTQVLTLYLNDFVEAAQNDEQ